MAPAADRREPAQAQYNFRRQLYSLSLTFVTLKAYSVIHTAYGALGVKVWTGGKRGKTALQTDQSQRALCHVY
jgi:hypothetical protein